MILSDLFEHLQYGELAHLAVGRMETDEQRKQVISHINLGLLELHKRFWLISKNISIHLYEYVYEYILDSKYLVSNQISPEPYRYIVDSIQYPFEDDLLKVEAIYDSNGLMLPLNDYTQTVSLKGELQSEGCSSFFTPQYNVLKAPVDYKDSIVVIQYRARHPKIPLDADPEKACLNIPEPILEPLLLFIGHRFSRILNSDANQESNNYYQQYENACKNLRDWGYEIRPFTTNIKLDNKGWV